MLEGIQVILAPMEMFPYRAILSNGFRALGNIVHENPSNANLLAMELGGIPFLIQ